MKLIKVKFTNKAGKVVEIQIADDTIKRVIKSKRLITIVTPVFPRGFKNQVIRLSEKDFNDVMEQING